MRKLLLLVPLALTASCAISDDLGPVKGPAIPLVNSAGQSIGGIQAEARAGGRYLRIAVQGLAPGEHGLHLHSVGRCDGPDFRSAGPHWNPASRQHGHLNPQGAHAGDLPNIIVSANGRGAINFLVSGELADADGTALAIHAKPDDYKTDPSGDSGDRLACAVIAPPKSAPK